MDGYGLNNVGQWPEHMEHRSSELTLLYMYTLTAIKQGHPEMAYLMAATLASLVNKHNVL